ncbi:MAG TPA: beta-eliminating lyase-related protein, partial [Chthoniobacterales bacterium]|nr:beta-eliminating lyase-related protein [Chthoniobacterales bacterium]
MCQTPNRTDQALGTSASTIDGLRMHLTHRYDLASDNTAGMSPEAWAALEQANRDTDASYGSDRWTQRVCDLVREIFETNCEVFFVFNGTAANSLALAQLCRSFH